MGIINLLVNQSCNLFLHSLNHEFLLLPNLFLLSCLVLANVFAHDCSICWRTLSNASYDFGIALREQLEATLELVRSLAP
jgi:hypothetical protein